MRDYLKEYCKDENIKLKYTKNKSAVLSIGNGQDIPSIRIHKMFKNCTEDTADKIIKYYKFYQSSYSLIKFIQDYAREYNEALYNSGLIPDNIFNGSSTINTIQIKHSRQKSKNEKRLNEFISYNGLGYNNPEDISKKNKDHEPDADICIRKHLKDTKVVDVIITKSNSIMFTFKPQKQSMIHGIVKKPDGEAAKNALVKLFFKKAESEELSPVSFKFTDDRGKFEFELPPGEYVLKVFYYDMQKN